VSREPGLLRVGVAGRVATLVGALAAGAAAPLLVTAQAPAGKTVWDGVYTEAQAARGRSAYQQHCAECHGASLEGGEAVALKGDRFNLSWRESSVDKLFKQMSTNMPMSEDGSLAGTLARGVYIDIVALVLQNNGFPAGAAELTPENAVGVAIQAKSGPGELPHSASAQVVGCLTKTGPRAWKVTRGSKPVRSGPLETPLTSAAALGDREFPLLFVLTNLDKFESHRVLVTGRLEGEAGAKGINVTTVGSQGAACQ
jgi:S-disulfanyl-L-cysteine oxidoreductase SoxD